MSNEHNDVSMEAANEPEYQTGLDDLQAMDDEHNTDPNDPQAEPESEGVDSAAVVGMAEMGLFMSEQYLSSTIGMPFSFDDEAKQKFLAATAPLVEKHGLTWVAWFDNYKEEVLFALAAFGLGYSGFSQLKRLQAEKAANDAALKQGGKDGEKAQAA